MAHLIVGVFATGAEAREAVKELHNLGMSPDHVELHSIEHTIAEDIASEHAMPSMPATEFTGSREALKVLNRVEKFFDGIFPEEKKPEEVGHFAEAVRRGNTVVTVDVEDESKVDAICRALWSAGALDLEEQVSYWRAVFGYSGYESGAPVFTRAEIEAQRKAYVSRRENKDRGEYQPNKVRVFPRYPRALE